MNLPEKLTDSRRTKKLYYIIAAVAFVAILPIIVGSDYIVNHVITLMIIFSIYASSWNLLASSGQGSLGHALFLGIGGFASAMIGGTIATGLAAFMGLDRLPIGALSVTIQVLVMVLGGLISAGIG